MDTEIEDGTREMGGAAKPDSTERTDRPDWQAVVAERMTREDMAKEDGRYLVYYRFEPAGEA